MKKIITPILIFLFICFQQIADAQSPLKAVDDYYTTSLNTPVCTNFIINDTLQTSYYFAFSQSVIIPKHGVWNNFATSASGIEAYYYPTQGFTGIDTASYELYDFNLGLKDTGYVYFTVTASPTPAGNNVTTLSGVPVLLGNLGCSLITNPIYDYNANITGISNTTIWHENSINNWVTHGSPYYYQCGGQLQVAPVVTTTYILEHDASTAATTKYYDTVIVTVNYNYTVNAGADQTVCSGSTVTLGGTSTAYGGSGNYVYSWSPSIGLNYDSLANPYATPTVTTTYVVTVVDTSFLQTLTDTVVVNIGTSSGSSINQSISCSSSYLFNGNNLTTAGTYYDTLANYTGCDSLITLNLTLNIPPNYVLIPDTNFVTWLNGNGFSSAMCGIYMDTTNALVVNATSINCSSFFISNLSGVQYFNNLDTLICLSNQLTVLPALPVNLTYLDCSGNNLTSVSNLPNSLLFLDCGVNNISSLSSLPTSLDYLSAVNNQIVSVPSFPSNLTHIDLGANQLISIPALPNNLFTLSCMMNQLSSLPTLPVSLNNIDCSNNPNLHCLPDLKNVGVLVADTGTNILCIPNIANLTGSWLSFPICTTGNVNGCFVINGCSATFSSFSQSICTGGSFLFNGNNLTTAGAYVDTLINYHGCDSIITLNLSVGFLTVFAGNDTTICQAAPCTLVYSGSPVVSYTWVSGTSGATVGLGSSFSPSINFTDSFYLTVADINGCIGRDTVTVFVVSNPTNVTTVNYQSCFATTACANILLATYNGTPPYTTNISTLHNGIYNSANNTMCWASAIQDTITVTITDMNGCSVTSVDTIVAPTDCVWPGDADDNLIADNFDVLPIGLAYNFTGFARVNPTLNWVDQPCLPWLGIPQTNGADWKHADCNGDGIVNANDTMAIHLNFGLVHPKPTPQPQPPTANATLSINIMPDTCYNGTHAIATISLNSTLPTDSVYGLAFTFNYDPLVVDTNTVSFTLGNSWLFTSPTDHISLHKIFRSAGQIKVGCIRTDHTAKSGTGALGVVDMDITTDDIAGKGTSILMSYILNCFFTNVIVVGPLGNVIPVNLIADSSVTMYEKNVGLQQINANAISIYPNPASDKIVVNNFSGYVIQQMQLLNVVGEVVKNNLKTTTAAKTELNVETLPNGIYTLTIKTNGGVLNKKVAINR